MQLRLEDLVTCYLSFFYLKCESITELMRAKGAKRSGRSAQVLIKSGIDDLEASVEGLAGWLQVRLGGSEGHLHAGAPACRYLGGNG